MMQGKIITLRPMERADIPRLWEFAQDMELGLVTGADGRPTSLAAVERMYDSQWADPAADADCTVAGLSGVTFSMVSGLGALRMVIAGESAAAALGVVSVSGSGAALARFVAPSDDRFALLSPRASAMARRARSAPDTFSTDSSALTFADFDSGLGSIAATSSGAGSGLLHKSS